MSMPRIITAAERAAKRAVARGAPEPKTVRWHKKNADGTRCKTCKPIVVPVRTVSSSTNS